MTTHTPLRASPPAIPDQETRLALVDVAMTARLATAAVAFEVNTAHIPTERLPEITAPLPLTPAPAPSPYSTPIAATLHRARVRLGVDGWSTTALRDDQGARCLIGTIRAEAPSRATADDACVLLLEAIQRDYPHAETIPSWNAEQRDHHLPARYLDTAAQLAHNRRL